MARPKSAVSIDWWDYTTLDPKILRDAGELTADQVLSMSRPGFEIRVYDTLREFYLAEALEYIDAWRAATPSQPTGVCGPVGPVEQLPLVAKLVNDLDIDLSHAHFWGMDEWVADGREVSLDYPLSFERTDREMCFDRIKPTLRMPEENLHFPKADTLSEYTALFDQVKCLVMQGGQGDTKHWAFNDPPRREGEHTDAPPPPEKYLELSARLTELHPLTRLQNCYACYAGRVLDIPPQALTVGPVETWKTECVSIWHPGCHDNPFGQRLTTLMIREKIADCAVPMSLLALHPNVRFNFLRSGVGSCQAHMY